jgi:DNA-binding IclR family transcriptional regulator
MTTDKVHMHDNALAEQQPVVLASTDEPAGGLQEPGPNGACVQSGQPQTLRSGSRGIRSIEVGGALLQVLVRHGRPMPLKDLAGLAGMPAAKAHPYLVSFGNLGLVEQDPSTGRYGLGPFALQMGLTALHGLDPVKVAIKEITSLADEISLNVAIAVWGNMGPTVVHLQECSKPMHVNMRPGTVMVPLMLTATGRVFAAFMPERMVGPFLLREQSEGLQSSDLANVFSPSSQADLIRATREHRMARALGNPIPGINAFSAPVFNDSGQLALAITAMGPAGTFDTDWQGSTALRIRQCADTIENRLGNAGGL